MRNHDPSPLRALLHRAFTRYLTITPHGFVLAGEVQPVAIVEARILAFGGARTLYRNRKPWCRSLDAVASVTHADRRCAGCNDLNACTPQVRVDLVIRHHCYRLLLAFSSARNFLDYEARLHREQADLLALDHELRVTPRGSWGEVLFTRVV